MVSTRGSPPVTAVTTAMSSVETGSDNVLLPREAAET
jgi:hypothetical protein